MASILRSNPKNHWESRILDLGCLWHGCISVMSFVGIVGVIIVAVDVVVTCGAVVFVFCDRIAGPKGGIGDG